MIELCAMYENVSQFYVLKMCLNCYCIVFYFIFNLNFTCIYSIKLYYTFSTYINADSFHLFTIPAYLILEL